MDQQIFSDLEQKIEKLFSKKKKDRDDYNDYLEMAKHNDDDEDVDLFLSLSKVSMLFFRQPDYEVKSSRDYLRVEMNAPVLDGMFPLHLAVLTSSGILVENLLYVYKAKLDVKCCDPSSPFYGLTPLEMALDSMRFLIPWTPQLSVHELLCMFRDNERADILLKNIFALVRCTPRARDIICNYSLQGKVVELASLLKATSSSYGSSFSTMYIPTTNIPPELHFGVPMMLPLLVASKSASLVKEGIQVSGSLNPEEDDYWRGKIKEMDAVRLLLESAERGDLIGFNEKQQLTVELTDSSLEGSQDHSSTTDESKVNTVAPHYLLKNSLFYVEPSIFRPHGILNSLMPRGYNDSLHKYDGLDIRNGNALVETIFRLLDGRKVEELSFEDTRQFQYRLASCFGYKFEEVEMLTALEKKRAKIQVKEKKRSTPRSSLPRSTTKRTTSALTTDLPSPLTEAFEHLDIKKLSSSVFSAIKKGRA